MGGGVTLMSCQKHLRQCALAHMVRDLRANADPDREAEHAADFTDMMEAFYANGDHFGDYDGPLTSVATNSVAF